MAPTLMGRIALNAILNVHYAKDQLIIAFLA